MFFKNTHYCGWKIYKQKLEHNYYLAYEVAPHSARNFYLYPKASFLEKNFQADTLHLESRYSCCLASWHKRSFLNLESMTECSWWKVENRAPRAWIDFLEVELERILGCSCFPQTMGRGRERGSIFMFCDRQHLLSVDRKHNLVIE